MNRGMTKVDRMDQSTKIQTIFSIDSSYFLFRLAQLLSFLLIQYNIKLYRLFKRNV